MLIRLIVGRPLLAYAEAATLFLGMRADCYGGLG